MRALWTQEEVTFLGEWHAITAAGINPLPVQQPIPVWIGGSPGAVADRVGRIGDGWISLDPPTEARRDDIEKIREAARAAGRDPANIGLEAWVSLGGLEPEEWATEAELWCQLGMTHLTVNTEFACASCVGHQATTATTVGEHIAFLEQYREVVGDLGAGTS